VLVQRVVERLKVFAGPRVDGYVGLGDGVDELPLLVEAVNLFAGVDFYLHGVLFLYLVWPVLFEPVYSVDCGAQFLVGDKCRMTCDEKACIRLKKTAAWEGSISGSACRMARIEALVSRV